MLQEAVGDTLQELWISYNNIEKLKGITVLAKLKVYTGKLYVTLREMFIVSPMPASIGVIHVQQ